MVAKSSLMRFLCLGLFAVISVSAFAQEIQVAAVPLHRFRVSNATLGLYLTPDFNGGGVLGYSHFPFVGQADIVPLVSGYQPRADQNLKAVHAWRVNQNGRIYYYYSIYVFPHGNDYTYLGIIGYALPKFDPRGIPFQYWYSQSYGYYYTVNNEFPPCCTFAYHDYSWHLPVGGTFVFEPVPPPQGPCPGTEPEQESCALNNGNWNFQTCSCDFGGCDQFRICPEQ
jgi:hypothetical protein